MANLVDKVEVGCTFKILDGLQDNQTCRDGIDVGYKVTMPKPAQSDLPFSPPDMSFCALSNDRYKEKMRPINLFIYGERLLLKPSMEVLGKGFTNKLNKKSLRLSFIQLNPATLERLGSLYRGSRAGAGRKL